MKAYYNEHERFAAAWLEQLAAAGEIASGHVDARGIEDVRPADLAGYDRAHFFAGIGGWDLALRLAGWPEDRPVWTGSCPCQPFSSAGKGGGFDDSRHLWPTWFRLIRECRPDTIFGEQVSSGAGLAWFDHVAADLEAEGYAVGALDTSAAGVGAPHIRQRLYWVAHLPSGGRGVVGDAALQGHGRHVDGGGEPDGLAYAEGGNRRLPIPERGPLQTSVESERRGKAGGRGELCVVGNPGSAGLEGRGGRRNGSDERALGPAGVGGHWSDAVWLRCRDGKARPIAPQREVFPLAPGLPGRVGTLRGAGNALCVPQAKAFVRAFMEATS